MADSTWDDALVLYLTKLVLPIITLIPGLVIHSFIIGVNVNDWWKGRSVTSIDHIVTSLGISRMGAQCLIALYVLLNTFVLSSQDIFVFGGSFDAVYVFFIYFNIWLTSLLSIVFCLKISNLRTRLFLYLRRVIDHRPSHFIVASGLFSGLVSLMILLMAKHELTNSGQYNTTVDNILSSRLIMYSISFAISAFFPLLFYYTSSVLLFSSLYHHTVKMKRSSNLSINLETYYSAMKFVSVTFIYNTIYFIGLLVCAFYYYVHFMYLPWLHIILAFLTALHSSYLIYRTSKLRSHVSKVYQNIIDFLF